MKIICEHCGKEVEKSESEVTRSTKLGRPMFCSISCGAKHSASRILEEKKRKYSKSPRLCECCKSPLDYDKRTNRFCSSSCAAKINNVAFPKKKRQVEEIDISTQKPRPIQSVCIVCGKPCERKYCSNDCQGQQRKKLTCERIESGDQTLYIRQYRSYLISKRGNRCEECGWDKINPKTGRCPIELEHIDGDHTNNQLSNLKLLCPNCHSLTPTYKNLNKGRGRHTRMKRYNEGKSY